MLSIPPKAFELLVTLAESDGQTATREEIKERVWGAEAFVDHEKGIHFLVHQLRNALDDRASAPRYIETLPRYGYRLIPPVEEVAPRAGRGWFGKRVGVAAGALLLAVAGLAGFRAIGHDRQAVESAAPALSPVLQEAYDSGLYHLDRHRELGIEIYPNQELLERSRDNLDRVAQAAPDFAPGHLARAEVLFLLGETAAATEALARGLALAPDAIESLVMASSFNFYRARRFDLALEQVDRVLLQVPDRVESLVLRAGILTAMGRHEESAAVMLSVQEISPRSPRILGSAALLATYGGSYEEAIRWGRETLELEPRDPIGWHAIIRSYAASDREQAALASVNEFLKLWGHPPEAVASLTEYERLRLASETPNPVAAENQLRRGLTHWWLGHEDQGFDLLLAGCRDGGIGELPFLQASPGFASLRRSRRWGELERCVFDSVPAMASPTRLASR